MRITTLVENTVNKPDLIAEHGLSFLLETEDEAILFDTGQGYAIRHNAEKMGIDLTKVQKIVISHGHYDHTGGLEEALKCHEGVHVYGHPNIFERKYSIDDNKQRFIGIPYTKETLESKGVELNLSRDSLQIADNILTTGEIERQIEFEVISNRLCVMRDGIMQKDDILDDLALVVFGQKGIAVILGCGHSGIVNTLIHVCQMTNNTPISLVVGGIHLIDATSDRIHKTIDLLREFNIERLALCHCTGMLAMAEIYHSFGCKLIINNVGTRIEF
jgi:7,8-dihydropterin-6-yl-methyl-4-(beta-D-ribofuranosyl)aminobenzene 5'-phosphate synthase